MLPTKRVGVRILRVALWCSRLMCSCRRLRTEWPGRKTSPMKKVLMVAAVGETATGVALLTAPSLVGQLLLGGELTGMAATVARVFGIALIGLGIACWPGPPRIGMLTYGAAVTLYLAYLGFTGGATGMLLWPAVVAHLILTVLLARAAMSGKETKA